MTRLLLGVVVMIAGLAIACGGDDDDESDNAGGEPSATQTSVASPLAAEPAVFSSSQFPVSVTVTSDEGYEVPAEADTPVIFVVAQKQTPYGYVDFLAPTQVYNHPPTGAVELSDPPADYVKWFQDNPFLSIAEMTEVTVAERSATRLDISNDGSGEVALFQIPGEEESYHF